MSYDKKKYIEHKFPHPMFFNWVLNPLIVLLELPLGLRMPKKVLLSNEKNKTIMQRQRIICDHCDSTFSEDVMNWAKAFGNWFGIYCPNCEKKIPCHWNILSILLIFLLMPVWLPIKVIFGEKIKAHSIKKAKSNELSRHNKLIGISYLMYNFFIAMFITIVVVLYFVGFIFPEPLLNMKLAAVAAIVCLMLSPLMSIYYYREIDNKKSAIFNHANTYEKNSKTSLFFSLLRQACYLILFFSLIYFSYVVTKSDGIGIDSFKYPLVASATLLIRVIKESLDTVTVLLLLTVVLSYIICSATLLRNSERLINDFEKKHSFTAKSISNCKFIGFAFLMLFMLDAFTTGIIFEYAIPQFTNLKDMVINTEKILPFKISFGYLLSSILFFAISKALEYGAELKEEVEGTI